MNAALPVLLSGLALGAVLAGTHMLKTRVFKTISPISRGQAGLSLEIVTPAAGWLLVGATSGDWLAGFSAGLALSAALIAVRLDLETGTVPDFSSLLIAISGLVFSSRDFSPITLIESLTGLILAGTILLLAAGFVKWRSGQAGLGEGDIGLGAACATWTGVFALGPALLVAVALTGLHAILLRAKRETRLPFAPGLLGGFAIVTLIQVTGWLG